VLKYTDFESWWKTVYPVSIQNKSNIINACRYAFNDGVMLGKVIRDSESKLCETCYHSEKEWDEYPCSKCLDEKVIKYWDKKQ
jgi:hypothetical protein